MECVSPEGGDGFPGTVVLQWCAMSQSASRSRQLGVHKPGLVFTSEVVSHKRTYSSPHLLPVYFLKILFVLTVECTGTTPRNI